MGPPLIVLFESLKDLTGRRAIVLFPMFGRRRQCKVPPGFQRASESVRRKAGAKKDDEHEQEQDEGKEAQQQDEEKPPKPREPAKRGRKGLKRKAAQADRAACSAAEASEPQPRTILKAKPKFAGQAKAAVATSQTTAAAGPRQVRLQPGAKASASGKRKKADAQEQEQAEEVAEEVAEVAEEVKPAAKVKAKAKGKSKAKGRKSKARAKADVSAIEEDLQEEAEEEAEEELKATRDDEYERVCGRSAAAQNFLSELNDEQDTCILVPKDCLPSQMERAKGNLKYI